MHFKIKGIDFHFSFWFFAVLASFLLLDKGTLAPFFLLPIILHELGHLLVMWVLRVRIRYVEFSAFGVEVRKEPLHRLSYGKEIAICLAGCAANVLMALGLRLFCFQTMRVMLLIAINLAVAIFNLLPIGNLDGGQVVRLLVERFSGMHVAHNVSKVVSFLALTLLFATSITLFWHGSRNITLPIICLYLAGSVIRNA